MAKARPALTFTEEDRSPALPLAQQLEGVRTEMQASPLIADQQMIQIGTRVPAAVYRQVKILAAQQGVTIATLVVQALSELLVKSANGAQ